MSKQRVFTPSQQNVIDFRGKNMLVSASAGTGKTTVMIERIVSLIEQGADVSEIVVVTFTTLASAEMKARLASKLAEKRNDPRIVEQIEKLDTASICTLHSFCNELLKNYFYVVDVDPAFTILDSVTTATLRKNTLDDVFEQYFSEKDDVFRRVYKIFATHRREENFKDTIFKLYNFSRCLDDFPKWYAEKRENFVQYGDENPIIAILLDDVKQSVGYYRRQLKHLAERATEAGLSYAELFGYNEALLAKARMDTLQNALNDLFTMKWEGLPRKKNNVDFVELEESIRGDFTTLSKDFATKLVGKYSTLTRGEKIQDLWQETVSAVEYTDKLVEIVERFDTAFFQAKKQRGGVDFNDLEHLTLQLLNDEETLAEIKSRCKLVFVDEYQDTNPVQEAIVSRLQSGDNLFMVGDVKQSIYGFRGCEPSIFVDKYDRYKATGDGRVEELNDNFRSNSEILDFVNCVFNNVMTSAFGKVDYKGTAQLRGETPPTLTTASTRVDLVERVERVEREIDSIYDITQDVRDEGAVEQGELIAQRIKQYVGMAYRDKSGEAKRIGYGDIVILMRSLTDKAIDIYNTLVSHNIPVSAGFKVDGFSSKEVKDLVTLLRVIDNPYNDVYLVGACLAFGGLTEKDLGHIRLDTEGRIPFYERLQNYTVSALNADIATKIDAFLEFLRKIRFYSRSASVCEIALKVLEEKDYHLYVQSLPNGGMRLRKLYSFIDSVKDAPYAQSVDKFLCYVDETEDNQTQEGLNSVNAVRLMTMHASKGLEFPIVIVAGVETQFPFLRFQKPMLETNLDLGLATRFYNFDNMRVADTLGATACGIFNGKKQREEEMRLLYVALTRAKFVLNVVGSVTKNQLTALPKLPTRAMTHLDWLMPTIKRFANNPCDSVEINVIESLQNDDTSEQVGYLCEQTVTKEEVERSLKYEYKYSAETRMPTKVVSSALDKEYLDVTEQPQVEYTLNSNNDRNFVGTAYHKVYQYVNYDASVKDIVELVDQLVKDGKIEKQFADKLDVQLIHDTLNNPQLRRLIAHKKVYHEIPFMLYVPYDKVAKDKRFSDEVMLQGVIDLLVVDGSSATVIDFKYTSRSDLVEQNYTAQLNSYRLAVQRICGIDDVKCYVLSIADNKLISM